MTYDTGQHLRLHKAIRDYAAANGLPWDEEIYEGTLERLDDEIQRRVRRCPCCGTPSPAGSPILYCDDCNTDTCGHWCLRCGERNHPGPCEDES